MNIIENKVVDVTKTEKEKKEMRTFFTSLASLVLNDLNKNNKKNDFFKKYKKEDIIKFLGNAQKYEKDLRNVSRFLYINSAHYKRLINYFSNLSLFYYDLKPSNIIDVSKINKNELLKEYYKLCNRVQNMNLSHEFSKILTIAFKEDVFYGYEYENDISYLIKQLNPNYCHISSNEDGIYNFQFDFSYFDTRLDKLNEYGKEFKKKYKKYKKNRNFKYQELNSERTICIKINEEIEYPIPPFSSIFEEIYDINDYKLLKKAKEEIGNYQLLSMKIPMDKDNADSPMLSYDTAKGFYGQAIQSLPDQVGMILSPMDIGSIKFERDKANSDKVIEAEDSFWSGAGVNGNLFNSKGNSGSVVDLSIKTDEAIVFKVLKQCSRWLNRKIKYMENKYTYKFSFLDVTVNNREKIVDQHLKLAQYGIPVKTKLCSLVGMSMTEMITNTWLENDVLKLHENWLPLNSSHTQTDSEANGRPKKESDQITESGEQTRKNGDNDNKNI